MLISGYFREVTARANNAFRIWKSCVRVRIDCVESTACTIYFHVVASRLGVELVLRCALTVEISMPTYLRYIATQLRQCVRAYKFASSITKLSCPW